jgi:hypothetical protein
VIEVRVEGEQLLVEYDDGDSAVTLDPGLDRRVAGGNFTPRLSQIRT